MAGGPPGGIMIRTGEDGCRTMRRRIRAMTMHGNRRTTPSGIEMDELPRMRIRRRKKASRGEMRSRWREMSSREGRLGDDGMRLTRSCTRPIGAEVRRPRGHRYTLRDDVPTARACGLRPRRARWQAAVAQSRERV